MRNFHLAFVNYHLQQPVFDVGVGSRVLALGNMLFNILSVIGKGIEFAYVLGKFVVDNGKLFEADAVQLYVENAVLSFRFSA